MTLDKLEQLLENSAATEEEILAAMKDIPQGEVSSVAIKTVLLQLDEENNKFRHGADVRLRIFELLPAGDIDSLDSVIAHLDLVSFRDVDDEIREKYLEAVDEKVRRLARPFAYQDPEELATHMAKEVVGREVALDEELPAQTLRHIRDLCDIIMGGGHFPSYDKLSSLGEVVDVLERNL